MKGIDIYYEPYGFTNATNDQEWGQPATTHYVVFTIANV